MDFDRVALAETIAARLQQDRDTLASAWKRNTPFAHCTLDDSLPEALCEELARHFPASDELMPRNTLRERKRVGIDLDRYDPAIREILFAFQEPVVLREVEAITGIGSLEPDPSLYASGISVMGRGDFLNPHLDNSHDGDGIRYRAINVLFYVTPGWSPTDGGQLELWNEAIDTPHAVATCSGRSVFMATHQRSWHSVRGVTSDRQRLCVSNYYFTREPPGGEAYHHVTSFAGRPEQPLTRALLRVDRAVLGALGRWLPSLTRRSKHRIRNPE